MANSGASGNSSSQVSSSSSSNIFISDNSVLESNNPLWGYTTTIVARADGAGGGNRRWKCNFCKSEFTGSYSRVKSHLLRLRTSGIKPCTAVTEAYLREMVQVVTESEERAKPKHVPLPSGSLFPTVPSCNSMDSRKRKSGISSLEKAFQTEARDQLNCEIARMFYSGGLPFHLARNPHYINAFKFSANHHLDGFIPPSYNALRTTLLQKEQANIENLLTPIKNTWREKGISLVSDGWTDAQRRPLINFMAATEGGAIFLRAIDGSKEYKDKHFIAKLMQESIAEVGAANVVQIITDNAPVCKAAGLLVEGTYPHIFWTPCVVHTLNLALKNICAAKNTEKNSNVFAECYWITNISDDIIFIRNFIMNHSMRLSIFNSFVPLKLLTVADTRFASTIVMLKRLKLIKRGLQTMVLSDEWNSYREDDVQKAQTVKEYILNDVWWDKVDYIIQFTKPIYDMLRFCDTDKPTLHLVYDMWDSMIEQVKAIIFRHEGLESTATSPFYNVVYDVLIDRWTKSCTPLHCMAHSLNPRYYTLEWINEGQGRVPPHKDDEISIERNKCMRRYFPDLEERNKAISEFARFSACMSPFDSFDSLGCRWTLDPKLWWITYGTSTPRMQTLALKLLGQPCSSSCCERNWSTYSFIHSIRRNKILPKRAEDLVFIHTNLRLLSRKSEEYKQGSSKMWDIGGDNWDSFEGAGVLEVASLSLDEPDMEAMIFVDDGEGTDEIETLVMT